MTECDSGRGVIGSGGGGGQSMSGRDSFAVDDYAPGGGAMEEARSRKSPLVLMGAGLTAAVLGAGLFSFYRGNQATAQVRKM